MEVMSVAALVASAYFNCFTRMVLSSASFLSKLATMSTMRRTALLVSVMMMLLLPPLLVMSASVLISGCRSCFSFTASMLRTGITCVISSSVSGTWSGSAPKRTGMSPFLALSMVMIFSVRPTSTAV